MGYVQGQAPSALNPWADAGVHSNGFVIDPLPPTPDEKFRTLFTRWTPGPPLRRRIECAHSADGIHWVPYSSKPTFGSSGDGLDDVAVIHYDPDARQFVMNTRHYYMGNAFVPPGTRSVSSCFQPYYPHRPDLMNKRRIHQTRSHDFLHWSDPICVSAPDDDTDNLDEAHYGMSQFRVGRLHFATLGILRYVANEMDVRLIFSRDGKRGNRRAGSAGSSRTRRVRLGLGPTPEGRVRVIGRIEAASRIRYHASPADLGQPSFDQGKVPKGRNHSRCGSRRRGPAC